MEPQTNVKGLVWYVAQERKGVEPEEVIQYAVACGFDQEVRVVGHGEIPEIPTVVGEWMAMKAEQYDQIIPAQVNQMVAAYINGNFPIAGCVVLDELASPKITPSPSVAERIQQKTHEVDWEGVKGKATTVAKVVAIGAGVVAVAALALPLLALSAIGATAMTFDPIYCIVIPDTNGKLVWYSLHEWWD